MNWRVLWNSFDKDVSKASSDAYTISIIHVRNNVQYNDHNIKFDWWPEECCDFFTALYVILEFSVNIPEMFLHYKLT